MEEWIGSQWHRWVTRQAGRTDKRRLPHEARLADLHATLMILLKAGGAAHLRVTSAVALPVGGERPFWQRVAGMGGRAPLAQLDGQVLALPERVARYDDAVLNRDLYVSWAALACAMDVTLPWTVANARARERAVALFPGLDARLGRLAEAEARSRGGAAWPLDGATPSSVAPVWTWIVPVNSSASNSETPDEAAPANPGNRAAVERLGQRRRATLRKPGGARAPLLLAPKGESLKTFADPMSIDRADDDDDDGSAAVAAEELESLTLQRSRGSAAARVRFDLDLPSASADDLPVGPGESLPEWDVRLQSLVPDRVLAQRYQARDTAPWRLPPALRAEASRIRRRLDVQRAAPRWQRGVADGSEIDLDAWVRQQGSGPPRVVGSALPAVVRDDAVDTPRENVYRRRVVGQRDIATLLLADLSLSTDSHANDRQRIIDVIRESLAVFGEALSSSGDAFAIVGFSSVRRQLRLHDLKRFDESWGPAPLARLGALRPGYYTRMGAALRAGTRQLQLRPERQKLLLLLTDGKPHDIDSYEGRLGIEDTRQAVREARRAGLLPFALSIDSEAGEVMPQLFGTAGVQQGQAGWVWVRKPQDLPRRLGGLYAQLMR